ncbi:hypothetical protein ABTX35_04425 [Streptomyces sp. NPDC096080]
MTGSSRSAGPLTAGVDLPKIAPAPDRPPTDHHRDRQLSDAPEE